MINIVQLSGKNADYSTILGILIAIVMIVITISINGSPSSYIDIPSILIVVVGTLTLTAACYSISDVVKTFTISGKTVFYNLSSPKAEANNLMHIADSARKNSILSLQNLLASGTLNPFLEKGLQYAVDGIPVAHLEKIMIMEIEATAERHKKSILLLRKCAEISPGMGLIGTLLGLVQMLGGMNNPSTIGPAMAVALLTTLYGAILSFMIFTPLATKLERNSKMEILLYNLYLRGIVSIANSENPHMLEALFNTMLPPDERLIYGA